MTDKTNVTPLVHGQVTASTAAAVHALDNAIVAAITEAKKAQVPQGLIVGIMHAHAHQETAMVVGWSGS